MLLHMESFDISTAFADLQSFYTMRGGNLPAGGFQAAARTGIQSVIMGGNLYGRLPVTPSGDIIVGVASRFVTLEGIQAPITIFDVDATQHLTVRVNNAGKIELRLGTQAGTVIETGASTLIAATWYYIELRCNIHDTTGSYSVYLDGVLEMSDTNVDTRNGATGVVGEVGVGFWSSGNSHFVDDWYVCDTSGSYNNDILGPIKIECLLPSTGNGTNTGLTPSTGVDHGALVDEADANTTDYNGSATVGVKDTYNYPAMSLTGGVKAVQLRGYAVKTDSGDRKLTPVVRSGGADYDGVAQVLQTTFSYAVLHIYEEDPDTTAPWDIAGVNAAEFGVKVAGS